MGDAVHTVTAPQRAPVGELETLLRGVEAALDGLAGEPPARAEVLARAAGVALGGSSFAWLPGADPVGWSPAATDRRLLASALAGGRLAPFAAIAATVAREQRPLVRALPRAELLGGAGELPGWPQELVVAAVPGDGGTIAVVRGADHPYLGADLVVLWELAALLARRRPRVRGVDEVLAASRGLFRAVAAAAPVLLFACDRDGRLLLVEGALAGDEALALSVGRSVFEAFAGEPELEAGFRRALAGEVLTRIRLQPPGRDLEAFAVPLRGVSGEIEGIAGIAMDVSERVAAEATASETSRRLTALVENATDIIAVITPHGIVRYANPAVERILGRKWVAGQVVDLFRLIHPDDRDRIRGHTTEALRRRGVTEPIEFRMVHAGGDWRWVEAVANYLLDDPAIKGFVLIVRDVTARRAAEQRSELNAARQREVARLGRWALGDLDLAGLLDDAMGSLTAHLGAACVHVLDLMHGADLLVLRASRGHAGASDGIVLVPTEPTASPASLALSSNEPAVSEDLRQDRRFELPALWSDSQCGAALEVPIPGPTEPAGVLGVCHRSPHAYDEDDVNFAEAVANVLGAAIARHGAEAHIREQSTRDQLTGLPNRVALVEHLDTLFGDALSRPRSGALLVLDVDRFKEINDTLGHDVGDRVLVEVADRLQRVRDQVDVVARLGGDEFGIYSSVLRTAADGEALARRLLEILGRPIELGGARLRLRGSVGVAEAMPAADQPVPDAASLLRRAEAAMYLAKQRGSGCARWTPDLENSSLSRLSLVAELGEAMEAGELMLAYQPKIASRSRRPLGVEALVRWRHPQRGTLLPDSFLPLAEQTGMIRPLTSWVLGEALGQWSRWRDRFGGLTMAVNLSASTLADPELTSMVVRAVERSGIPPDAVELEITESAVMHDPDRALEVVTELSETGLRFAIDDFGTGYSSLTYLQRLPVALVKVDKSFVTPLPEAGTTRSIVRAVIDLAHSLGIAVVAEGVESAEAASLLVDLGCDELQGYHIGRPMAAASVETWLGDRLPVG